MNREFTYIVYGASGYTGQYVVERFARFLKDKPMVKWAVAGRNEAKINKVLAESSKIIDQDLTKLPIVVADTGDQESLVKMAKRTSVVANCVGPYCKYGESVVKACVENGCSHVDISGETQYLEGMQARYDDVARKNNCYIVGACGWDSIPADLGVDYLIKYANGQQINTIETFFHSKPGPEGYKLNAGTYQSVLLILAHGDNLKEVRKKIMPERMPETPSIIEKRGMIFKPSNIPAAKPIASKWAIPFLGSDRSVIIRSLYSYWKNDKKKPPNVDCYFLQNSFSDALKVIIWGVLAFLGTKVGFIMRFMQNNVELCTRGYFSNKGPSRAQVNGASFSSWFVGYLQDKPKQPLVVRIDGPDPGYVTTAACISSAAITIIEDREKLPKTGGVYTSAAAFGQTKIYDRLAECGITFNEIE